MGISTWYQSKIDQSEEHYTRSLKFEVPDYRNQILITSQISPMAFNGLRHKYALNGSSNYIAWKDRMEAVLEDNRLKGFIDQEVPKPETANA